MCSLALVKVVLLCIVYHFCSVCCWELPVEQDVEFGFCSGVAVFSMFCLKGYLFIFILVGILSWFDGMGRLYTIAVCVSWYDLAL